MAKRMLRTVDPYYTPSSNGHKIMLFPEKVQLQYRLIHVSISKGGQLRPDFLQISPNNKIPAIIDYAPVDGGRPVSLSESGEILLYLAEKNGKLPSGELRGRRATLQRLFWQVSGLGPMLGQNHHFSHYAPQTIPYVIERYQVETQRPYNMMDKRLETSPWLGSNHYSTVDIVCWPWIHAHQRQRIDLDNYPVVNNWHERIRTCPVTERAMRQVQGEKQ